MKARERQRGSRQGKVKERERVVKSSEEYRSRTAVKQLGKKGTKVDFIGGRQGQGYSKLTRLGLEKFDRVQIEERLRGKQIKKQQIERRN